MYEKQQAYQRLAPKINPKQTKQQVALENGQ